MTTNGRPRAVEDVEQFWIEPPLFRSSRCEWWVKKIEAGWRPNRRISMMGYYESARFFGVFIWEYLHVIAPMLEARRV